jgi:phosphoribosylformylglycinamidine synthase subunit PurL
VIQPEVYREMGLNDAEYQKILGILGREPTITELGMFAVMWSEHCGYKYSRPVLALFKTYKEAQEKGALENAGVIPLDENLGIVFKIESHNHPSAVEPFQGAATGVGGILRDIFTMGARPIANLNSLRFGPLEEPRNRYLFEHVVAGIAHYGNCVGVPTIAGEIYFHPCYSGNPLVNAMAVGVVELKKIASAAAKGVGNPVIYVGSSTGKDGIHGATFASAELDEESESKRPNVQMGDPFLEKLLIEATLEALATGYIVGIQDMGAAGLTCSTCETAAKANNGMEIDVRKVPLREANMTPYEIMLSESQERMLCIAQRGSEKRVMEVFHKWGLNAVVVGHVTDDGLTRIKDNGEVVAEVPAKALTDECPTYYLETHEPDYIKEVQSFDFRTLRVPIPPILASMMGDDVVKENVRYFHERRRALSEESDPPVGAIAAKLAEIQAVVDTALDQFRFDDWLESTYADVLLKLLDSPSIASKTWVTEQYDSMVQTQTVALNGGDAAILRIRGTRKGIAVKIDGNGRYGYLDPYVGGQIAVAEAARNVACVGARPVAVTDNLNFANPQKPDGFWQFRRSVEGIAKATEAFGTPVVSGNVSFYNETPDGPIFPTPTIGMLGILDDVNRRCQAGFREDGEGDMIVLLTAYDDPTGGLGGSEYLSLIHGLEVGVPPKVDLEGEKRLQELLVECIGEGLFASCHDISEGGLAVCIAESAIASGQGAAVLLKRAEFPGDLPPSALLFGEAQGRVVVTLRTEKQLTKLKERTEAKNLRATWIGTVGGQNLRFALGPDVLLDLPVTLLDETWRNAIPRRMTTVQK